MRLDRIDELPDVIHVISGKELPGKSPCEFVCFGVLADYQNLVQRHIQFPSERIIDAFRSHDKTCIGGMVGRKWMETLMFFMGPANKIPFAALLAAILPGSAMDSCLIESGGTIVFGRWSGGRIRRAMH